MVNSAQQAPILHEFFRGERHTISEVWQRWFIEVRERGSYPAHDLTAAQVSYLQNLAVALTVAEIVAKTEIAAADNQIVRADGANDIQGSSITIDDSGNINAGSGTLKIGTINRDTDGLTIQIGGTTKINVTSSQVTINTDLRAENVQVDTNLQMSNLTASQSVALDSTKRLVNNQQAHIADATGSHAITDPADTPADADALRDDLVANTIPDIETALDNLGEKINSILSALETAKILASS